MTMPEIDPEMAPLVAAGADPAAPNIRSAGPAAMRAVLSFLSPSGGPEMRSIEDATIGGVPVRDYRPTAAPRATILFLHGGGWTVGSVSDYDCVARTLAAASGCRLVSVDYRRAPEHPFPAAVDDVWAVLSTLTVTGPLFVAGDSAGGNLSAVVAQMSRDAGGPALAGQILIYPSTAGDCDAPSMRAFAPPMMPREDIAAYYDLYVPKRADRRDPRFAPALGRLDGLPPALVITAGADLLAAEGEAYAEALAATGTPVMTHRQPGALHAYFTLLPNTRAAKDTITAIIAFIDDILEGNR